MKAATINILSALAMVVAVFSMAGIANADTIVSQTSAATSTTATVVAWAQTLGNGLSGYTETVRISYETVSFVAPNGAAITLYSCTLNDYQNNGGFSSCTGLTSRATASTEIVGAGSGIYSADWVTAYSFDPALYYVIEVSIGGLNTYKAYGSATASSYTNGAIDPFPGASIAPLADMYFSLDGQVESANSRVISLNTPTDGQVTSSQTVNFQFSYYSNPSDLYTVAGITLTDLSSSQSVVGATTTVSGSGTFTASLNRFLSSGHQYRWSAYLQKASGQRITSQSRTFYVVSAPSFSSSTASMVPIDQITEANASSTILQTLNQTLNIFSLVQNKIPFAYVFAVGANLSYLNSPATSQAGEVALDLGDIGSSSAMFQYGRIVIFSTTTVSTYLGPYLTPIRALCDVVLYVTTGLTLFAMRRQIFV